MAKDLIGFKIHGRGTLICEILCEPLPSIKHFSNPYQIGATESGQDKIPRTSHIF